jgi:hypothetical protein
VLALLTPLEVDKRLTSSAQTVKKIFNIVNATTFHIDIDLVVFIIGLLPLGLQAQLIVMSEVRIHHLRN